MSKEYTQKTAALNAVTVDTHILDANKILLYPGTGERSDRVNILDIIKSESGDKVDISVDNVNNIVYGALESSTSTFNTNTMNGSLDNATATGIQYSKAHFINNAKVTSLELPFTYNSSVTSEGYLCAQIFDEGNRILSTAYSTEKRSFNTSDVSSLIFEFTNLYIPRDYKTIIFSLVESKKVIPNVIGNQNVLTFRCKPVKFNNTFAFDDDDCQVYNGSTVNNWLINATVTYKKCKGGLDEKVFDLENRRLNYAETEARPSLETRPTSVGEVNAIHMHQDKVPHDAPISAIEIDISKNTTAEKLYLVAYTVVSNVKTLAGRSVNAVSVAADTTAKWTFETPFTVPTDGALELYIAKANSTIGATEIANPGVHIGIYLNDSGSDTIRYGNAWYGRDVYLVYRTVTTEKTYHEKIDEISDKVTYLESNSGTDFAKKGEDNTFTATNTFNSILKNNSGVLTDRSVLNKAELDENYIIANEDNKHIVDTLNDTINAIGEYATGWVQLKTNTNTWSIWIGEYGPYQITQSGTLYAQDWSNFINSQNIPYEAYPISEDLYETTFVIKAKNPGAASCVPFGFGTILGDRDTDQVGYSGETLELPNENIKKIDFLSDAQTRFAQRSTDNTFSGANTFEQTVTAKEDIIVTNGIITFEDLIDGTVIERSGASGYRYVEGIPSSFNNGVCYDIGEISNTTNLSNVTFSAKGRLVQTCELWFTTPATVPTTHQWPVNTYWIDSANGAAPTLIASKNYRIVFRQEPNKIIASIAYMY